jgi:hypothetical protein
MTLTLMARGTVRELIIGLKQEGAEAATAASLIKVPLRQGWKVIEVPVAAFNGTDLRRVGSLTLRPAPGSGGTVCVDEIQFVARSPVAESTWESVELPPPPPPPIPRASITIASPTSGSLVERTDTVSGTSTLPPGTVVTPVVVAEPEGVRWEQRKATVDASGKWETTSLFGREGRDRGVKFTLWVEGHDPKGRLIRSGSVRVTRR